MARLTSHFLRWRRGASAPPPVVSAHLRPETSFFAVGDIHGCAAQLDRLFARLEDVAHGNETCVFLGDYIDRGPNSREVLRQLFELSRSMQDRVICLMGNHERMMLNFIDDPAGVGGTWLQYGGVQTLASFGVEVPHRSLDTETSMQLADALEAAMPAGLQDWLRKLPKQWSTGNMYCVHAAMSPKRPPEDQRSEVLLWGHPDFLTGEREDGNIIVHGHTIVRQPGRKGSRIAVDTGAYRTGRLTAAHVLRGECRFIGVR